MASKRKPPVIATGGGRAKSRAPGEPLPKRQGESTPTKQVGRGSAAHRDAPDSVKPESTVEPAESGKVSVTPIPAAPTSPPAAKARPKSSNKRMLTGRAPIDRAPADRAPAHTEAKVLAFPNAKERQSMHPGGRFRRWRLWAVLGAIAVVVLLLMLAVLYSPLLALKTITVDGTKLASQDQIQGALAPLKGKPLPQIDQAQVQGLLGSMVQVESVSIEARPPATLLVHVVERIPVAVLKNGEQYVLVDPQGTQLGTVADPATAKLPLIDGGTAAIGQATFASMTAVLAALPEEVRAQMRSASATSPNAVELTLVDGKKVVWGDSSQMALKAKVLQTLLKNPPVAEPKKPAPAPINTYDVSSPKYPVTR